MHKEDHPDISENPLAALDWQLAMGANEAVSADPLDHFQPLDAPAIPSQISQTAPPNTTTSATMDETRRELAKLDTLAAISEKLDYFDACPLKATASNLCFYDGKANASVMLIGEAPGRDEDLQGKPFMGRAGQLLDQMLAAIDLNRNGEISQNSVFITNAVFWRPPGNRKPTEAETIMCLPFLIRTIEVVKPDVIICLGATPLHRLTGRTDGILKARGRWLSFTSDGREIPLMATLHPAYLLANPAQKQLAWRDCLTLREHIDKHIAKPL